MGLASALRFTSKNVEFAGLRIRKGGEYNQS
jgi:hypothetical protein